MYKYFDDKNFIREMRRFSGDLMQDLCHHLKQHYDIGAIARLDGSVKKISLCETVKAMLIWTMIWKL